MTEVLYNNEQFYYIVLSAFWIFFTYLNAEDIKERIANKFNAMLHLMFTAPLFYMSLSDSYINGLVYGYFFTFALLFTTCYIVALKYIMNVGKA